MRLGRRYREQAAPGTALEMEAEKAGAGRMVSRVAIFISPQSIVAEWQD